MNNIYKIVWNAARGCYVVGSELMKTHQGKKAGHAKAAVLTLAAGLTGTALISDPAQAAVTVAPTISPDYVHEGTSSAGGKQYEVYNQQVNAEGSALNRFSEFTLAQQDVANLHLDKAERQINVVDSRIDIDGVVNAIKDNKIGGDVYFFSESGIAVGTHGVFNVGRLTLGTNPAFADVLFDGGYYKEVTKKDKDGKETKVQEWQTFDTTEFYSASLADKAAKIRGSEVGYAGGNIEIRGQVHAADSLLAVAGGEMNITGGARIRTGSIFNALTASTDYHAPLINTASVTNASKATKGVDGIYLGGANVVLESTDGQKPEIRSAGRSITLSVEDATAYSDMAHGSTLVIREAYIDSSAKGSAAGDITLSAEQKATGVGLVSIDGATITAKGQDGQAGGTVSIEAKANATQHAWDLGVGASAKVEMGKDTTTAIRNAIDGKNVSIKATASTTGEVGEGKDSKMESQKPEIHSESGILELVSEVIDLLGEEGYDWKAIREMGSVTDVHSTAKVDIAKTDITALAADTVDDEGKAKKDGGNISIAASGTVKVTAKKGGTFTPYNVAIGNVDSEINVDDANLYAAGNVSADAKGANTVTLEMPKVTVRKAEKKDDSKKEDSGKKTVTASDESAAPSAGESTGDQDAAPPAGGDSSADKKDDKKEDTPIPFTVAWSQTNSDVKVNIGKSANISSEGNTSLTATATRTLKTSVENEGTGLRVAVAVGVAKTDADVTMAGHIYANGAVTMKALNTVSQTDGMYNADTVSATSLIKEKEKEKEEESKLKKQIKSDIKKIKKAFADADTFVKDAQSGGGIIIIGEGAEGDQDPAPAAQSETAKDMTDEKKAWNQLDVNASTTFLYSENNATTAVTGKVRGLSSTKNADGTYQGAEDKGAGSVTAEADVVSRTSSYSAAFHVTPKKKDDSKKDDSKGDSEKKEGNSISLTADEKKGNDFSTAAAIAYTQQRNHSEAYISGDVLAKGDVNVKAETAIPWQTKFDDITTKIDADSKLEDLEAAYKKLKDAYKDPGAAMQSLVDTWTQSAGNGENAQGAGSLSFINYDNSAKAYIAKKGDSAPSVKAGGDVNVTGATKITTVNLAGVMQDFAGTKLPTVVKDSVKAVFTEEGWTDADDLSKTGLGGSALAVRQANTAEAYIDGEGTTVEAGVDALKKAPAAGEAAKTGSVNVSAANRSFNVALAAAGGKAKSLALDASIGVSVIDNAAKAFIGESVNPVKSDGGVTVTARDYANDTNLVGGFGTSGETAIGASISYNHINRDTEACVNGQVETAGNLDVTAKNEGQITSGSIAGAVALDQTSKGNKNNAGSTGLHKQNEDGTEEEGQGTEALVGSLAGEENVSINDSANEAISEAAGKDSSLKESAGAAKDGLAIAGNVSVNRITDSAKAHIGGSQRDGVRPAPAIVADAVRVTAANDSTIAALSGTIAANTKSDGGNAIAGSFMYNAITAATEAYVDGANLTVKGNEEEGKDESLTVSAENAEHILNISASGAGTGKGNAVVGQISVNQVDDTTTARVKDSTLATGEAVEVKASDNGKINSYTGAVAVTTGGESATAFGAALAVNLLDGKTTAAMEDSTASGKGSLTVKAEELSNIASIVAAASVSDKTGVSFSTAGNAIHTTTDAHLSAKGSESEKTLFDMGAVSILAKNHATTTTGVGALSAGARSVGGSLAVVVNDSTVTASAASGAKNTLKSSALTIEADNSYNGDAKDAGDDSTAKTVAIGAAGGASKFSGAGSVTVNVVKQTTKASLGEGVYDISGGTDDKGQPVDGAASVTAKSSAKLFGLAGGLTVSGAGGVGAAVDVQKYTGETLAGVHDGASISHADSLTVKADSAQNLTSVGAAAALSLDKFSGAGAAGAHSVTTNTKAYVGDNTEKDGEAGPIITDVGDVSVTAKDVTTLSTGAGSAGATAGSVGLGLSAAVEVMNKNVEAVVGSGAQMDEIRGLSVQAENTASATSVAAAVAASAGTAAVSGSASENFASLTTKAHIGKKALVLADEDVTVKALSQFKESAGAGGASASAGALGAGVTNATVSYTGTTEAYVDDDAAVVAKDIAVDADTKTDVTYGTAALSAASTAGLQGVVGVNVLDTHTKAYTGQGTRLSAERKISLTADDETILQGGNGGLAVGGSVGAGAAIGVAKVTKDTEAYTGNHAKLQVTKDLVDSEIAIQAANKEAIKNITLQGAGGSAAGIAGAVNVTYLNAITKAYTGSNTSLLQAATTSDDTLLTHQGKITVDATHEIGTALSRLGGGDAVSGMQSVVAGAAGSGGASVGAAIDVGVVRTQTNAYLGNGNIVQTAGDLSVKAKNHMEGIASHPLAASVGTVGVSGSISVYSFGSTLSAEDEKTLSAKAKEGGSVQSLESWLDEELKHTNISDGFASYDSDALADVKAKLPTSYNATAPDMAGEKGTLAAIGGASQITAGTVTVDADDKLSMESIMGNISGAATVAAGASVAVVNTNTETHAKIGESAAIDTAGALSVSSKSLHELESRIVGASLSAVVAGQGTVSTWNDTANVGTTIGQKAKLTSGGKVALTSENTRKLDADLVGASAALYGALNGAVITAAVHGEATTTVDEEAVIDTTRVPDKADIAVDAKADTQLLAGAVGAALGAFAGTGTGVSLSSDVAAKTAVGNKAQLTGGEISITAENTPILKATATSAGLGLAGVGVTVAKTDSKDKAQVVIGNSTAVQADKALTLKASMAKPTALDSDHAYGLNGYASATAGAGGVLSGAAAISSVNTDQVTSVDIGTGNTFTAETASITSDHRDAENLYLNTVGAGALTGTGGVTSASITSDSHVTIGDGTSITTEKETTVLASNETEKAWREKDSEHKDNKTADISGAGLATGAGLKSDVVITHNTTADLGAVTIKAHAALTEEEIGRGYTVYDKNAIDINAKSKVTSKDYSFLSTGAAIETATIKNTNTVNANTAAAVKEGAALYAGDTEEAKATYSETYGQAAKEHSVSYRGGSIGVGTRNDAELDSTTVVDIYGAAGHAGSSNDVTYNNHLTTTFGGTAETAKGDIFLGAGRDSDGSTGTVKITAKSDVLNATVIPIDFTSDPTAKAVSTAALSLGSSAKLASDRDVGLKAKTGDITAVGYGQTKSWVNSIKDVFGEGTAIGKTEKTSTANVEVNGTVETGIHRNKTITIGGHTQKPNDADGDASTYEGGWVTKVDSNGDVSYRYGESQAADSVLYDEYDGLLQKIKDYGADPAAKAAYEAELTFLEQKMAEKGLGYFEDTAGGGQRFVLVTNAAGGVSEFATIKTQMETLIQNKEANLNQAAEVLDFLKTEGTALEGITVAYNKAIAEGATEADKAEYKAKVEAYNTTYYGDSMAGLPTDATDAAAATALESEKTSIDLSRAYCEEVWKSIESDKQANYLKSQMSATDQFFANGGKESEKSGRFSYGDYTSVITVDKDGKPVTVSVTDAQGKTTTEKVQTLPEGDVEYSLLHKNTYRYMNHDIIIEDITAQLGDIDLEGDNVYGSGTLHANGDASVTIENQSPNNIRVGNVSVVGSAGTSGAGQGGTIYYNDSALRGKGAQISETIKSWNKDKTKVFGGTIESRDDQDLPSVSVTNDFDADAHTMDDGRTPLYAASTTYLTGYIYNPRGTVKAYSKEGDIKNNGTILGGTVSVEVKNGDYTQSYDLKKTGTVTNIGGAPLTDEGAVNDKASATGITASGNVFISARYLNINSKIQSGMGDVKLKIASNYGLYYKQDGVIHEVKSADDLPSPNTTVFVGNRDANGNLVSDADMEKYFTYSFTEGRILLNSTETSAGHISIVGTILNTTKSDAETGAALIARDGYGSIDIENLSDKDLEIRSLSTGNGEKGIIEITDLDRSSGKITRKTTYTRENGAIVEKVETYADGKATGTADTTHSAGESVSYKPAENLWYNYQTGQSKSYTATYKFDGSKFDWWGINNRDPSEQEMETYGEKISDPSQGKVEALNGGAFLSGTWQNGTDITPTGSDPSYHISTNTSSTDKQVVGFYKDAHRQIWTFGLTKKYNYTLVEKKTDLQVKQYSLNASNPISISFTGQSDGGHISIYQNGQSADSTASVETHIRVNGHINNGVGDTSITNVTGNIIQSGKGYISTGTLALGAGKSVGVDEEGNTSPLITNADKLSGYARTGNFAVSVEDNTGGEVLLGRIEAAGTATIHSEGSIGQQSAAGNKDPNYIQAKRVELEADEAIYGAYDKADEKGLNPFRIKLTGQTTGSDTGLYARAYDDIYIKNEQFGTGSNLQGGDMYIDSVISYEGNVQLDTDGSFRDNNFSDVVNQNAADKLEGWAREAILESKDTTIEKQKDRLAALVEGKYSEYQALKAHVKDGTYEVDDDTKALLGGDAEAIKAYREKQQARYDELTKFGVGGWTSESVSSYVDAMRAAVDTDLYGNADLTEDNAKLAGDAFLTKEEKVNCLVHSAKSIEQLLVSFAPGGIKEGITDTQAVNKEIPHVSGENVVLNALGKKVAAKDDTRVEGSGSIGYKTTGLTIDLSSEEAVKKLTTAELIALASAERDDFSYDPTAGKVTVSAVESITADVTGDPTQGTEDDPNGTIEARAAQGAIYLTSNGAFNKGSEFYSSDEMRLKIEGDLTGITAGVGEGKNLILESGSGAITDVGISGQGILTARAKKGIDIYRAPEDEHDSGDIILYTAYASEGDVTIDMKGLGSLYTISGYDDNEDGTPFTNIQGENVYIYNAENVKGIADPTKDDGTGTQSTSTGIKVTGHPVESEGQAPTYTQGRLQIAEQESTLPTGSTYEGIEEVNVTLLSDIASSASGITGEDVTINNRGTLTAGTFIGKDKLTVNNTAGALITTGYDETEKKETAPIFQGGTEKSEDAKDTTGLSLNNKGSISEATFEAVKGNMTITNTGKQVDAQGLATKDKGEILQTTFKAKEGNITYEGQGETYGEDLTFQAESGGVTITDKAGAAFSLESLQAKTDSQVEIQSGTLTVQDASVTEGSLTLKSGSDMTLTTVKSAKDLTAHSGGTLTADKLEAQGTADLTSKGNLQVKDLTANAADMDVTEGNAKVDSATITEKISIDTEKGNIETGTVTTKDADMSAGGTLTVDKLTATGTADLRSVGDLYVKDLAANVADIDVSEGHAKVDKATISDKISIDTVKGDIETGTVSTKGADYNAGGALNVTEKLTATGTADLDSVGDLYVKDLAANTADLDVSEGNAKVDTATITDKISIDTVKGNIETGTVETKDADMSAGGTLTAEKLTATGTADLDSVGDFYVKDLAANVADIDVSEGHAKVDKATITEKISIDTVKGNIETGTVETKDADYNAGGTLTADKLIATGTADLDSVGDLYVKDLSARKADIDVTAGDATVGKALVEDALSITASGDVTAGTAETRTGSAAITAGQSVSIGTLTSGEKATVKALGGDLAAEAITANKAAELYSAGKMIVENLISKEGDIVGSSGGAMDLHKVEAKNGKVTLHAGSTMDVDDLDAKNADLISKDTMTVIDSQIAETLKMNSGRDIIVNRSDSVTLDMDADGSIKAETMNGKSAYIHTGSGTLKAGGDILITDKDAVEKLQGVDTSQPAGKTNGAGEAGSLYLADATPSTFDVSKKGDAVLSVDKSLTMTGKNVEADTVKTGNGVDHISINADNLGIDDLQSEADRLHVMIHGSDGKTQAHYAGLHTTSDKTVVVAGSRVETLNFTGKDDIGIEDTALGGDSTMQNSFIRFELRKNPRTDMAEWISKVHLKGYGIDTDHPMSRVDDGLPINGNPYEDTAYSAMNRSLFGGQYLGKDGREREEDDSTARDLRFGEVSPKESYEAVGASEP